jgi:hypothetical protein
MTESVPVMPRAVLGLLLLLVLASGAPAQTAVFAPPRPTPQAKEWIRLKSGEWLRGEIKSLRKEKLEFESEELDDLVLDWEDIREIISPLLRTYVFVGRRIVVGTAVMKDGVIAINTDDEVQEFPVPQLISITAGLMRRRDHWSGAGSLHIVSRAGNTNQADFTTILLLRRSAALSRFQIDYSGTVGQIDGDRNVNTHSGNAALDIYLAQRFFATLPRLDVFSDEFQNIRLRLAPGAGLGYIVVDTRRIDVELGLSGGYQWTRFVSVEEGQDLEVAQGEVTPNVLVETQITKVIDLDLDFNARIGVPDTKQSFVHLFTVLSFDLTDVWDFEAAFTWDRVVTPTADKESQVPERDDYRFSYGLNVEF